jgi:hypothetical protein
VLLLLLLLLLLHVHRPIAHREETRQWQRQVRNLVLASCAAAAMADWCCGPYGTPTIPEVLVLRGELETARAGEAAAMRALQEHVQVWARRLLA